MERPFVVAKITREGGKLPLYEFSPDALPEHPGPSPEGDDYDSPDYQAWFDAIDAWNRDTLDRDEHFDTEYGGVSLYLDAGFNLGDKVMLTVERLAARGALDESEAGT